MTSYAEVFGGEPDEVVRPTTQEEVAAIVARAAETGKSVLPWGGGMGQMLGYVPERRDILLDLTGLQEIVAHEFADLTVTVQAGVTLAALQDALSTHNQYLPLDPPFSTQATIGGIVATNAFGPAIVGAGTVRDWLIGITVIDGLGRVVHGGGKVVKNVTGYDLPKIHVGGLGTLGIVVETTFKVAPRPEVTRAAVFTCLNPEFVARLHDETLPAMSLLRSSAQGAVLAVLYSGLGAVVESEMSKAGAIAAATGEVPMSMLPSGMLPPFSDTLPDASLIVRFSGTRAGSASRHNIIANLTDWLMVDTFPGQGHTDAYLAEEDLQKTLADCFDWAGREKVAVSVLKAPAEMRTSGVRLWHPLPPSLPIMRRLKETLDPKRALNPGRFVGGI